MTAVLLMAYGTPDRLTDVADYYTHIRGGRRPPNEAIADLERRYALVGGATPLRTITERVRDALEAELRRGNDDRTGTSVYVGMKHWRPYIGDTLSEMQTAGARRIVALALAPHYSRMSVGAYVQAVRDGAAGLGDPFEIAYVESWYREPRFVQLIADRVRCSLASMAPDTTVVFTAHSLPVRIREWNDPYEHQLHESAALVAERLGLRDWRFAWQSAGGTREPWIGPDILEYLRTLSNSNVVSVLQVPIGFVCDHLEILYDIDVEAKGKARELGIRLERTELPNAAPDFIELLATIVRGALSRAATKQRDLVVDSSTSEPPWRL